MSPTVLKVAVCLYTDVTNLDYIGPLELFTFLSPEPIKNGFIKSDILMEPTYFHYDNKPFRGSYIGPLITPDRAYDDLKEGEQFDIILVPGGKPILPPFLSIRPWRTSLDIHNTRCRLFTRSYSALHSQIPSTPSARGQIRLHHLYWVLGLGTSRAA